MSKVFQVSAQILKVDKSLGLVFGWGIICKTNGDQDYVDTQGHHIPEDEMLAGGAEFMKNSRVSGDMHARTADGQPVMDGEVIFAFPMTTEIAKAFGLTTEKTGLMIAARPSAAVLAKFASGEYTGFSIAGGAEEHDA